MISKLLKDNRIIFEKKFDSWEDAITGGAQPLLLQSLIEESYIKAMIDSVNEFGPYIVIAPNIAMPHSQIGSTGVNETSVSLMIVEEAVQFVDDDRSKDAKIFITLAAENNDKHMENMMQVAELFSNEELVNELIEARSKDDIQVIIDKYGV